MRMTKWSEHFRSVSNRPPPVNPVEEDVSPEVPAMNTEPPGGEEIIKALKRLIPGKSPGVDNISAEMLKVELTSAAMQLGRIYRKIWESESIPSDWRKGTVNKIPKKGDPIECDNRRGITLLSIPSKVLCSIIIKKKSTVVDDHLRKEQADFRKGRVCKGRYLS